MDGQGMAWKVVITVDGESIKLCGLKRKWGETDITISTTDDEWTDGQEKGKKV
jgi:hypothetical protein